jgi:teichuronic acid biosynthesis glycosyltransferase TuaH
MQKIAEPYILIAAQEWQLNLGSNARNLAVEMSKTRPVLYINPPIDLKTILHEYKTAHGRSRIKKGLGVQTNTFQAAENLWVHTPATIGMSISWLKSVSLFNRLNKINAKRYFRSLRKTLRLLNWEEKDCIVFNDSMMFVGKHLLDYLSPKLNFYYTRDNLVEHPYYERHGTHVEPVTIKNANAVFANSAYLADYARQFNPLSLDIGQGCELDIYDAEKKYPAPDDISAIPHPRIGYIGFLTGIRLDIPLLEKLAELKKDWSMVLIGPEEILFQQSKLHSMSNVYFLGSKKPHELPGYTQHLDVCMNPQLINPLTIGNYPRKIDEYLAMGKPTVATDTPAMKMFLPHVHLAVGAEQYVHAIENALQPQTPESRSAAITFAKGHSWKACVDKIYATQNQLLQE